MKSAKKERHPTKKVRAFPVFRASWCFLFFVALTPLLGGCASSTTAEIQEWGIVGYEDVYSTTQIIAPNGVIVSETQTPAGVIPIYGYYTKEVLVDPETRESHEPFAIIYRGFVTASVMYLIYSIL